MNVYILKENNGEVLAFEIENIYISKKRIRKIISEIKEVSNVKLKNRFFSCDDVRIDFLYFGKEYMVWEPFGDNSRYWIGPKDNDQSSFDITILLEAFKRHRPNIFRYVLGNLLSFKISR